MNLSNVVFDAIESRVGRINTAVPAKVVKVDGYDLDVKPLVMKRSGRGYVKLPIIYSVPFLPPSVGDLGIFFIPKVDDEVLLIVCKNDFDQWIETARESKPINPEKFSLSNAVAISGFDSIPNRKPVKRGELRIQNSESEMVFKANGDIVINGGVDQFVSYDKLLREINLLKNFLQSHTHQVNAAPATSAIPTLPPTPGVAGNFDRVNVEGIYVK